MKSKQYKLFNLLLLKIGSNVATWIIYPSKAFLTTVQKFKSLNKTDLWMDSETDRRTIG